MTAHAPVQPMLPVLPTHGDDHQEPEQQGQGVLFAVDTPAGPGPRPTSWRTAPLPSRTQGALFAFDALGPDARTWAAAATPARARRCVMCGRPLRSPESRAAGVGPGCAAKRGRAVTASVELSRSVRRRRHLQVLPAA